MLQVQKRVVHKTTSIWSDQCFHWIQSESAHCVVRSTAADADWRRHQCQLRHQHHNGPAWSSGASAVETEHESTWSDSCICRRPRDCTVNQYTHRHSDVISITTPGLYSESTHTNRHSDVISITMDQHGAAAHQLRRQGTSQRDQTVVSAANPETVQQTNTHTDTNTDAITSKTMYRLAKPQAINWKILLEQSFIC